MSLVGRTSFAQQPPGTVAVGFSVDDMANRVYAQGDLKWKGSFLVDAAGVITFDPTWSGAAPGDPPLTGWPTLYDDGPWTEGGHEPIGAKAHDHIWGVTVFVAPPASGTQTYEYGLIDASYELAFGNGWIWKGTNGTFAVDAGATAPIQAAGMVLAAFGKIDLRIAIDTTQLSAIHTWDTSTVTMKSSVWGWSEIAMSANGAGVYSLDLSSLVGKHGVRPHTGLLSSGDVAEFVFVLGGLEYMDFLNRALADGVSAAVSTHGHHFASVPVENNPADGNTFIAVP